MPNYPQCTIKLACFEGKDKAEFIDKKDLTGHVFDQLDEAMNFIQRNLPKASKIPDDSLERDSETMFPLPALREAVINAICHRDYSDRKGKVNISIFDNRLEIWNPGNLPGELTVKDLKKSHDSLPCNPLIAKVFDRRGLVEEWGRGTLQIVKECVNAGHPEPKFSERSHSFGVEFIKRGYVPVHKLDYEPDDLEREILEILSGNDLALREIMEKMENSPKRGTLKSILQDLRKEGLVDSEGHGRGAYWYLER